MIIKYLYYCFKSNKISYIKYFCNRMVYINYDLSIYFLFLRNKQKPFNKVSKLYLFILLIIHQKYPLKQVTK